MRVLITGAGGFLGRHVTRAVAGRGHAVRALVRPSKQLRRDVFPSQVEIVHGDLLAPSGLRGCLEGIDAVIHLAASVAGDEEMQFANTVVGTENLLEQLATVGAVRFVHCSTFSVYDWREAGAVLDESAPLERDLYGRDGYAIAKTWQERLVRRYAERHNWPLVVFRPGFIWGRGAGYPAGSGTSLGRWHLVFAPGRPLPLTYVENCAECFAIAVDHPQAPDETFNIVDDEEVSAWRYMGRYLRESCVGGNRVCVPYWCGLALAHLATRISKAAFNGKGKLPGLLMPVRFRARFRPVRFSNQKVRLMLGWRPHWNFDQAWERMIEEEAGPRRAQAIAPRESFVQEGAHV